MTEHTSANQDSLQRQLARAALMIGLLGLFVSLTLHGSSASEPQSGSQFNQAAAPGRALPENPLEWQPITSFSDNRASTMSTLYGNDAAVKYARSHVRHDYPEGAILALVTWAQREDPRWYGGYIPGAIQSVEFVHIYKPANTSSYTYDSYAYEKYSGSPLARQADSTGPSASSDQNTRVQFLLNLRAAALP